MAESRKLSVEQRAELERIAIRNRVKLQYQRMINDPRRPNTGIDPAIERWNFARQNAYSYFKATPKTTVVGLIMGIGLPACLVFAIVKSKTKENERIDKGLQKKPRNYLAF
ncbi:NADH dehydrogenase [ubiquinone] 1 beta subcomplex subunit 4-like [Apostichopus japonicus]|uniref:NADH dehydrogenase [ubiquinone] 1 beta subcomplex subunit 4-like n=1 Tax=Stichopus japonicus TaxID=307972 RepID=UPI003AB7C64B